eukprot:IDg5182t1
MADLHTRFHLLNQNIGTSKPNKEPGLVNIQRRRKEAPLTVMKLFCVVLSNFNKPLHGSTTIVVDLIE